MGDYEEEERKQNELFKFVWELRNDGIDNPNLAGALKTLADVYPFPVTIELGMGERQNGGDEFSRRTTAEVMPFYIDFTGYDCDRLVERYLKEFKSYNGFDSPAL